MTRVALVLRGCRVIDPANGVDRVQDLAIDGGAIVAAAPELAIDGQQEVDLRGRVVIPGIIDAHVHVARWLGGAAGHRMMARAGTVTAIDFAGPPEDVFPDLAAEGAGLNIGTLSPLWPGRTVASSDPGQAEVDQAVERAVIAGALGIKILGGHYPLTPAACDRAFTATQAAGVYLAFHAGTVTGRGTSYTGMLEALEIAAGRPFHLPHVNAYCRGTVLGSQYAEIRAMFDALQAHPNAVTESHLSVWNGTSGRCRDGVPESLVTQRSLELIGYPPTEAGLKQAIADERGTVTTRVGDENVRLGGKVGLAAWLAAEGNLAVNFPINPVLGIVACATERRADGQFAVDALATDGGGIPRNFLVSIGLALVEIGAFSLADLVTKITWAPARLLGLSRKGHLGIGADADVTVLDLARRRATHAIAGGRWIMVDGVVVGRGGTILTTRRGAPAARAYGLPVAIVDEQPWRPYRRIGDPA